MPGAALRVADRPRGFVGVRGADATSFLQRMVSNDVEALLPGDSCEALLLTAKGRVIAPMTVWRRDGEEYLLLTEPDVAERLRDELLRSRFAAKAHRSGVARLDARAGAGVAAGRRREPRLRDAPTNWSTTMPSTRPRPPRTSSACGSGGHASVRARSTIVCSPPRPASTSGRSASRRGATRARSRSRVSTTAAA